MQSVNGNTSGTRCTQTSLAHALTQLSQGANKRFLVELCRRDLQPSGRATASPGHTLNSGATGIPTAEMEASQHLLQAGESG